MNVCLINSMFCTTRKFKLIGLQNVLLFEQRSNSSFSRENKVSKSTTGIHYHSGFYPQMRTSKKYGSKDLLEHSLSKISNVFEITAIVPRRNMNILIQNAPIGKLSQGVPLTSYSLLRTKMYTKALEDENKPDANVNSSPQYLDSYAGPERDLINFPRPVRKEYPEKVRHGFVPEAWFENFYSKTGVTGPYAFLFAMMTFLISKEIYVLNHEFYTGISVAIMCWYLVQNFGAKLAAYLDKMIDGVAEDWEICKKMEQKIYEDGIKDEQLSQFQCEGQTKLFEIKKQVIAIQLECEYRKQLWEAYNEVVQQLEKELLKQQVRKCVAHKNIHQWVLRQIWQAITPAIELAVLNWSINRIQELAFHHQSSFFPSVDMHEKSSVMLACAGKNTGLDISPQQLHSGGPTHVNSEIDENNHGDEDHLFPLLYEPSHPKIT